MDKPVKNAAKGAARRTRKQPRRLAYRPELKIAVHRLPFVGKEHTGNGSLSFWNVPAKGDYAGGLETGKAIAGMYVKHLRQYGLDDCSPYLGWIVTSWMERFISGDIKRDSPEFVALHAQMIGFMHYITPWVAAAAREFGYELTKVTDESLLAMANGGLGLDDESSSQPKGDDHA